MVATGSFNVNGTVIPSLTKRGQHKHNFVVMSLQLPVLYGSVYLKHDFSERLMGLQLLKGQQVIN